MTCKSITIKEKAYEKQRYMEELIHIKLEEGV